MFGDFSGGGLFVETPEGIQHFTQKGVWFEFDGQHPHWTEDFTGDRYSIVAYCKSSTEGQDGYDKNVRLFKTLPFF